MKIDTIFCDHEEPCFVYEHLLNEIFMKRNVFFTFVLILRFDVNEAGDTFS